MVQTVLYRAYDANNTLLYIGISSQAFARFDQHSHTSQWLPSCPYVTLEHYRHRNDALKAEKAAIKNENPKFNLVHKEVA